MAIGKVLMTMFNVAPWGGLHENVWYSCRGLKQYGAEITVACRAGVLVDKLRADGIKVHVVDDWDDWRLDAEELASESWDIVHSHPFRSRELALHVAEHTSAKLISTFHGHNRDVVYRWGDRATSLVAVSRAHAQMLSETSGVHGHNVFVVPNAVRDEVLAVPQLPWGEKVADGQATVTVASRLDADKRALLDCVDQLTDALISDPNGLQWHVQVAGSGAASGEVAAFIAAQSTKSPRVRFEELGWVSSEDIPDLLRRSVIAVASGRGAAQSLAVGTPVVAFGSQGIYGLQVGVNLQYGLWGNFGGFPLGDRPVTAIETDVLTLLGDEARYRDAQDTGRAVASSHLRQSDADRALAGIYRL